MTGQPLGLTAQGISAMYVNYNGLFQQAMSASERDLVWPSICQRVNSTTDTEQYDFVKFLGGMKKFIGTRQLEKFKAYTYRVTHQKYENTATLNRDEINDNRLGQFATEIQEMAVDAAHHKDTLLAAFLNAHIAGTATDDYPVGFDGLTLFKSTHAWADGVYTSNQSNIRSGTNAGKLDLTNGPANLAAAFLTMKSFRKPNGECIVSKPTHLVVEPSLVYAARQILNSQQLIYAAAGTTDVVVERGTNNPIYSPGIQIVELPGLTTGYWALLDCSRPVKPLIMQIREDIEFSDLTTGERAFMTEEFLYGVRGRYAPAAGPWWRCVAGDGT